MTTPDTHAFGLPSEDEGPARRISLITATSVRTERLDWLIDSWVPRRSLTLLAGREGLGKSTIACGWAAQATRGELNSPPMNVAYLETEDSRSITVKPRLQAAGADLDRVLFIDVTTETGTAGALTLPGDTSLLARQLVAHNVGLVILDAAKSAMHSKLDGYRDDDVRQFLEPLSAMCDEHNMAVIGLVHFGKRESTDPGKLILGSVAWSQIARSVLSVAIDDQGTLVVTNTKGNLAPARISREARLESVTVATDDGESTEVGQVVWGDDTNVSAADLLVSHDDQDDDRTEAEAWLEDYLSDKGPTPRTDVLRAAQKDRVASEPTIKRAFKKLGGKSEQSGFPRRAMWSLPDRSGITPDPRARESDPTDPTGNDLRKRVDPTGGEAQSDHAQEREPTDDPADVKRDIMARAAVLEALAERPQTVEQISKSVTRTYRPQTADILAILVSEGKVEKHADGTFSRF